MIVLKLNFSATNAQILLYRKCFCFVMFESLELEVYDSNSGEKFEINKTTFHHLQAKHL